MTGLGSDALRDSCAVAAHLDEDFLDAAEDDCGGADLGRCEEMTTLSLALTTALEGAPPV